MRGDQPIPKSDPARRRAVWRGAVVALLALVGSLGPAAVASAVATGDAVVVSHTPASTGQTGNSQSRASATGISADGRFVAFTSSATNLVTGQNDLNGSYEDVFLLDRSTGTTSLVSHVPDSALTSANRGGQSPSISADGAFVVFRSLATNLVAGQADTNNGGNDDDEVGFDVFLYERATGTVTLVSHVAGLPATAGNIGSGPAVMSADGRFVAFTSIATNLVAGQSDLNNAFDAFLYDRATGTNRLVSHAAASATTTGNGAASEAPSISANGDYVAFSARATNLVAGQSDPNGAGDDVFVFERATGAISLASHTATSATTTANGPSGVPVISADGGAVAFESTATNLVPGQSDANGASDLFLFDRLTGAVSLVSHRPDAATTTANGSSSGAALSAGGNSVAFASQATNLVSGQMDTNGGTDIFRYQRSSAVVALVSHAAGGLTTTGNAVSTPPPDISGDGRLVAFTSAATNLVSGQADANAGRDSFLFDAADGSVALLSHVAGSPATAGDRPVGDLPVVDITPSGRHVVFESAATNLAAGQNDTNNERDVFVAPVAAGRGTAGDFDGDGDADVGVFRPSSGYWFVQGGAVSSFGADGDVPVPADYDGDGDFDIAVFRPSSGVWFVQGGATVAWGTSGDVPVPADYDGDGNDDIAVFRPSSGVWFVQGGPTVAFGTSGDVPVPADYDGDGDDDIAVFRPSSGVWFVQGGPTEAWGASGDIPVPADYDGDGDDDIAVFRPSTGAWFMQGGATVSWGTSGDVPVPRDYDGDGDDDIAVFRPSSGYWFVHGGATVAFGTSGDVPV